MVDIKLEEGMKNHPGFMPFSHCNEKTHVEEEKRIAEKEQNKK